jgi:hypothetical protein
MKCKCPLCGGRGEVERKPPKTTDEDAKLARRLKRKGFTIREIMVALGYRHPGSISHLLKKTEK